MRKNEKIVFAQLVFARYSADMPFTATITINTYIWRIQPAFGFRALKVVKDCAKQDFIDALNDGRIQNIALLLHGEIDTAELGSDEFPLSNLDFVERKGRYFMKKGYFLKHSCGKANRGFDPDFSDGKLLGIHSFPSGHIAH
jgi:hypothetical protein